VPALIKTGVFPKCSGLNR